MSEPDYYTLLGVPANATADAVRAAFHALARKYHPDRWAAEPEPERERAAAIYRRGAEAYRVLMDPKDRARYDQGLARGQVRLGPRSEPPGARPTPAGAVTVRTAKARPFLQKAQEALKSGDLKQAKLNLKLAINADPGNPALEALLRDVEARRG
jgi:curved DNA-binding protein CbpA